ncbi:MAG: hypothetical protein EYR95_10655, partial [Phormidium sp. SL48-SHIP]
MTRFIHDQFAKDYLEELLTPYGTIQAPRRVSGEVRQVDLWFSPNPEVSRSPDPLGILARTLNVPTVFEPYRNPVTADEVRDCLLKLFIIEAQLRREAKQNRQTSLNFIKPHLWILTPTASENLLMGFGATLDIEEWGEGIYHLASQLRTCFVVIHQLPRHPETLWLRILGRGRVQAEAIEELEQLPPDNPLRASSLVLLNRLKADLQTQENLDWEDTELIMRLSPLFDQQLEAAQLTGLQQGLQQGERRVVENLLQVRFGSLDDELTSLIDAVLQLPAEEFTPLLMQLSREELLERFR